MERYKYDKLNNRYCLLKYLNKFGYNVMDLLTKGKVAFDEECHYLLFTNATNTYTIFEDGSVQIGRI